MTVDYENNPNQRTPCVLVLDASGSMSGQPIDELNAGLVEFENSLKADPAALTRVQVSIICVGGPKNNASLLLDWTDCTNFKAFELVASGSTPLAEGILLAHETIERGKQGLRAAGISYTRPWMFVISDGEPTSPDPIWQKAVQETIDAQQQRKVEVFPIAVQGANVVKMRQISHRPPIALEGLKFRELFVWLTGSLSAAAQSRPGDEVNLPSTDPWRNVGI
jgi:uncharacterized protein YegL